MRIKKAFALTVSMAAITLSACSTIGTSPIGSSSSGGGTRSVLRQPAGFVPYAGVGLGGSFLNANTSGLELEQDQSYSPAAQLTLGIQLNGPLALEFRAADLGEATFVTGEALGYQVADASLLYQHRFGRWSGFARIGGGALFNDGDIDATQRNKSHFLVGAGAEYALAPRWALRAEWQGHDVDVMHSQLSVLYRFGGTLPRRAATVVSNNETPDSTPAPSESISQSVTTESEVAATEATGNATADSNTAAPTSDIGRNSAELLEIDQTPNPNLPAAREPLALAETQPLDSSASTPANPVRRAPESDSPPAQPLISEPVESAPAEPKPLVVEPVDEKIEPASSDLDEDGIEDASDSCVGTASGVPVFDNGCAMFGDAVDGLSFFPDTDRLTTTGTAVLDEVANALEEESDIRVTVAAHTRASSDSNAAMFLTRRRTIAIIRYLTSKGIDATRLRPEAYGDTQPLTTAVEPSDNDRVVLTKQ